MVLATGFISYKRGREVVILLAGGDKRTQSRDIEKALEMARML